MDQQLMTRIVPPQNRRTLVAILSFLFWTAAFAVAYTQWPLYSENQNTKFLHGLASAGVGALGEDWLANTIDPLPVFSFLVYVTARFLHQDVFYLLQAFLLGIYLFSLLGIADAVFALNKTRTGPVVFAAIVIAMHASLVWPFSMPMLGTSLGWLLQAGVANQYLFNPVFQPASFGVLLILSIYTFLRGHPYWAASLAASSALFHSTYLPSAGLLTLAYVLISWRAERSFLRAAAIGLLALAIVTPVLLYNGLVLGPTSPDTWARAQAIIVNDRIPHHSLPEIWFDRTVGVKIGIIVLALIAVRHSRLFPVILFCLLAAIALTLVQMSNDSDLIAFIAPWRMSVFLVPLSASLLIAWAIADLFNRYTSRVNRYQTLILTVVAVLLLLLVVKGVQAMQDSFAARRADGRAATYRFVQSMDQPGNTFLTPAHMTDFRLETGAPVVVTWKSHPYKDVEVIEWKERIDAVNGFYNAPSCGAADALTDRYGVTHILFEGDLPLAHCDNMTPLYQDDRSVILAIQEAP